MDASETNTTLNYLTSILKSYLQFKGAADSIRNHEMLRDNSPNRIQLFSLKIENSPHLRKNLQVGVISLSTINFLQRSAMNKDTDNRTAIPTATLLITPMILFFPHFTSPISRKLCQKVACPPTVAAWAGSIILISLVSGAPSWPAHLS